MVKGLKFAVVSAIFLLPFAYPHSALSRIWSLSYQEAVWMRVAFHLRPHGAVAPSDADVEAAIAAAQRALTQHGETAGR